MQTVFIWPNSGKTDICDAAAEACDLLTGLDARVLLPLESRSLGIPAPDAQYVSAEEGAEQCDFIICLGGDGTILRVAELAARHAKPLIGVNLGHVGFMTELERGEMHKIGKILSGKYYIDSRMMLELSVRRGSEIIFCQHALNDVILTKSNPFRIIQIEIRADGVPVTAFGGDGVIIATPTGSTAYSLSSGGPVIEPSAENIAITPICAHNLQARSFVFAPEREICIAAAGPDGSSVSLAADGQSGVEILPGDRVFVRRSALMTRLIRVKGRSFYHLLKYKLSNGGVQA